MTAAHLHTIRKLAGIFLFAVFSFALLAANSPGRSAHAVSDALKTSPVPNPTPQEPRITFDPSEPSTTAGNKITITAQLLDKDGKKVENTVADKWKWKIADPKLEEFLISTPKGNQLTVAGLIGSSKTGTTRPNLIPFIVTYQGEPAATGVVNIRLADAGLARGPIPPGIEPQVDIMWAVMPQKIVHDNFGNKIKKQYYGIEVVIGNDSGFDLELASVGFDLNTGELKPESGAFVNSKIPASGYRVTRASLQRRQQLNLRNMTLNTIKALGPVLTGFTPFFHNVNHRNNFVEGVNILSNPIEKGFELVWPDLTLTQLANLEDQSLRDNSITRTVVKNNTQVRFVVFVPKDLINTNSDADKTWRDQPLEVMKRLGRMILIGDQVEHINRVRVVSSADTGAKFSISGRVIDPCLTGVEGVTVTLNQANGESETASTDKDGRYVFENVQSGAAYTVTPSKADTTFRTPFGNSFTLQGNRPNVNFFTEQSPFTISGKITKPDGNDEGDEDDPFPGVEVELTSSSGAGTFKPRVEKTVADGSYKFANVPAGAVYTITPKPSSGKSFNKESLVVPNPNCAEKTYDFQEKSKEKPKEDKPEEPE